MKATLLIEIGVEELPPKALQRLSEAFAEGIATGLAEVGLAHGGMTRYATPRRLAVALAAVPAKTDPVAVEKAGPTVAIAFDDEGKPTPAAQGFARSLGTSVDALGREGSDKGERLVYRATEDGKKISELLQAIVDKTLKKLPVPKLMRWGDSEAAFVRPVHWLVALHGTDVIDLSVFGQSADRITHGHRYHCPDAIPLASADDYAASLRDPGHVMAEPDARRARVIEQVESAANAFGGRAMIHQSLADEVTALLEWPVGIAGAFDKRFLELPREVLIATLEGHQRYFPIEDDAARLMAGFVTVANIESRDVAQVVAGNERVVRPRLADALFFWEQDRRHGLAAHIDGLDRVSFQKELGSLADKSGRVRAIAARLASSAQADPAAVDRAAILAKTDLLTEMVGEFPELQGVMGHYYALDAKETAVVAAALESQYAPSRAGAPIAPDAVGRVLAIADRVDTLAGTFAIGRRPSGDKDPFGLRRAALGVLRTLIESPIAIDLAAELAFAIRQQPTNSADDTLDALWMFHMERLRVYYADQGITGDHFEAVMTLGITDLVDFDRRVRAVANFATLDDAAIVCGAHKRIRNILRSDDHDADRPRFDSAVLIEDAEKALATALTENSKQVERATNKGDYDQALIGLTRLALPLNAFFDQVMVMTDDAALQRNRIALLHELDDLCRRVADISCLSLD